MGPYCKFCDTRCFIPSKYPFAYDIRATCDEGMSDALPKNFKPLFSPNDLKVEGFVDIRSLRQGDYTTVVDLEGREYELNAWHVEEVLNGHAPQGSARSHYFRRVK